MDGEAEEKKGEKFNITEKIRENPWMLSSVLLGVLAIVLLVVNFSGGLTGKVISADKAGEKLLNYYTENGVSGLEIDSVKEVSGFYQVNFKYQGKIVSVYVTRDGSYFTTSLSEIEDSQEAEEESQIPKSDNPVVELFIWSYCPYGVIAQGPLAKVAELLKDKADFNAILYYGGHGEYETQQNKIQACIQKLDKEKYWDYATGFVENIYPKCGSSREVSCDKTESVKLMKSLGIDSDAVLACVNSQGEDLLEEHSNRAKELGVTGSPTLVINGVKANVARTAEAFKSAICEAFNTSPEECDTTLDSTSGTTSGSCE